MPGLDPRFIVSAPLDEYPTLNTESDLPIGVWVRLVSWVTVPYEHRCASLLGRRSGDARRSAIRVPDIRVPRSCPAAGTVVEFLDRLRHAFERFDILLDAGS